MSEHTQRICEESGDEDDRIPLLQRRHFYYMAGWNLLRNPFLRTKKITRPETWIVRRIVRAQRRGFGWE